MPMYIRTLSRELMRQGHEVMIVALEIGLAEGIPQSVFGYFTADNFPNPDVLLLNEPESEQLMDMYPDVPAYQIIHSATKYDAPIKRWPQINRYISSRKQITDWILDQGIPAEKIIEIPLPVDFRNFKQIGTKPYPKKTYKYDIASISTIDELRLPMFRDLIERAKAGQEILIAGKDYGALGDLKQYEDVRHLTIIPDEVFDVRPLIAMSKRVAGIYNGLITLEAKIMGKQCLIYDETGKHRLESPSPALARHEVSNVVNHFMQLFTEIRADIIIPHHNRADLLAECLKSIPKLNFNVIVAKYGGSFSHNCNAGALQAKTDNLIFLNDDTIVNAPALWDMISRPEDVVGCRQHFTQPEMATGLADVIGITLRVNENDGRVQYWLTDKPEEAFYPSGAIFRIRKDLFWHLGGLDERFINGGEDQALFLKAISEGASISFCMIPIIHHLSQSEGRFKYCAENDTLLKNLWPDERLKEMFNL